MTKFLKRTAKSILRIISRIIFWITPEEFKLKKKSFGLEKILQENLQKETFKTFGQHIKRGLIFEDFWQLLGQKNENWDIFLFTKGLLKSRFN